MGAAQTTTTGSVLTTRGHHPTLQGGTVIDNYPIKIDNIQKINLFENFYYSKNTLTWKDIVNEKQITFRKCVDQKIPIAKLHKMQPDIEEWIRHAKAELKDCKDMALWSPNPFYHFKCCIGDLVIQREHLPASVLLIGGVKVHNLWERYGLTPDIMALIKYSPEDWVRLGLTEEHLQQFNEKQWKAVFQKLKKEEVIQAIHFLEHQTPSMTTTSTNNTSNTTIHGSTNHT